MRRFTKYSNRKLYDYQESRYVTLLEIGGMVRGGEGIEVTQKGSGKDITSLVLAQVLVAHAERAPVSRAAIYYALRAEPVLVPALTVP